MPEFLCPFFSPEVCLEPHHSREFAKRKSRDRVNSRKAPTTALSRRADQNDVNRKKLSLLGKTIGGQGKRERVKVTRGERAIMRAAGAVFFTWWTFLLLSFFFFSVSRGSGERRTRAVARKYALKGHASARSVRIRPSWLVLQRAPLPWAFCSSPATPWPLSTSSRRRSAVSLRFLPGLLEVGLRNILTG